MSRLATGGLIDRTQSLRFRFNDRWLDGHPGDTLASALLAHDQKLIARSFKYHRPRGIFSAGVEEPNALVELGSGAHQEPNTRATTVELQDGLIARSQNHVGSLRFDLMAINDRLSAFLSAGFYYKTFMWPRAFWERFYEPAIRRSAGLGSLSGQADPDVYDKGFLHTDVLIIGAGPAGLAAALAAARTGCQVLLAEQDFLPGGRLNAERQHVDGQTGSDWAVRAIAELEGLDNVRVLTRCTVFGAYDHGIFGALELTPPSSMDTVAGHPQAMPPTEDRAPRRPRQTLWRIYARASLLATGATERSIAFGNNDRPGVMLAGSVQTYVNRYAVSPGRQVALFTNNDSGWQTARDLQVAGIEVSALVDTREQTPDIRLDDIPTYRGARVVTTSGRHGMHSLRLADGTIVHADCLAVSGGWNPTLHLSCHQRGRPRWRDDIAAFVPDDDLPAGMRVIGAANGDFTLGTILQAAHRAGESVAAELGHEAAASTAPGADDEATGIEPFWFVRESRQRAFVDPQNDVTVKDIVQSVQEGFSAVEHLKRYTTLGMATDQGKNSNVLGLAILAEVRGQSIAATGTTIFRPPYTPVPIAAFAGRSRDRHSRPERRTPAHQAAASVGASFIESGPWLRAQWFARRGETHWRDTVDREVQQTRAGVGVCDVTTLGKIDIQGKDAARFLDRVYANTFGTLAVGKVRYGLMLREDGFVMDDGTTARLGEHHYLMTTTTANAVSVFRHLEFCRQCLFPGLDVHLISATEQWAQFAVAGPRARQLLQRLVDPGHDLSNEAFPFMACGEISICGGTPARLFRISFSGELAYEIAVASRHGNALFETLLDAGKSLGVVPYGIEALGVMRIEKGHAAGNELTGQTTALNLGLGRMVSTRKDCIGAVLSRRAGMNDSDAVRLVGFRPLDRSKSLRAGAHFLAAGVSASTENDEGWMTSVAYSPELGHSIGLGFLSRGHDRLGEHLTAADPLRGESIEVEVVSPHFIDPDGERLRG